MQVFQIDGFVGGCQGQDGQRVRQSVRDLQRSFLPFVELFNRRQGHGSVVQVMDVADVVVFVKKEVSGFLDGLEGRHCNYLVLVTCLAR